MGTAVALAALPVDEFALAWDQTAPSPICVDWLGVDARGFELHEGDADKGMTFWHEKCISNPATGCERCMTVFWSGPRRIGPSRHARE